MAGHSSTEQTKLSLVVKNAIHAGTTTLSSFLLTDIYTTNLDNLQAALEQKNIHAHRPQNTCYCRRHAYTAARFPCRVRSVPVTVTPIPLLVLSRNRTPEENKRTAVDWNPAQKPGRQQYNGASEKVTIHLTTVGSHSCSIPKRLYSSSGPRYSPHMLITPTMPLP